MPRREEGVDLADDVIEIIDYLGQCFDLMEAGKDIMGDAFYARSGERPPLTDEEVDRVIAAIDAEYAFEIGTYPGYHRNRSGSNAIADFSRLNPQNRRAMVEGLDSILQRHKAKAHGDQTTT